MKAFHAVEDYAAYTIRKTGLGDSDFRVLEALLHKGTMAVNELGVKVFLTPGSISTAVERLHAQGFVVRAEDARDRRVRQVSLTPKGRGLIQKAFTEHAQRIRTLTDQLEPKTRRRLIAGLKLLGNSAARMPRE